MLAVRPQLRAENLYDFQQASASLSHVHGSSILLEIGDLRRIRARTVCLASLLPGDSPPPEFVTNRKVLLARFMLRGPSKEH